MIDLRPEDPRATATKYVPNNDGLGTGPFEWRSLIEVQYSEHRISLNPTLEFGTALVRDGESMSTLPGIVRMKTRSSRAVSCD